MRNKTKQNKYSKLSNEQLKNKLTLYKVLVVIFSLLFLFTPFYLYRDCDIYNIAITHTELEDSNLSFYKRDVFYNEESMNKAKDNNINEAASIAREDLTVLVVKIHTENDKKSSIMNNYVLIEDPKVSINNIEYYYANNMTIFKSSLPIVTVVDFLFRLSRIINFAVLLPIKIVSYVTILITLIMKIKKANLALCSR